MPPLPPLREQLGGRVMSLKRFVGRPFDNTESRLGGRERHVVGHYRLGETFQVSAPTSSSGVVSLDRDGDALTEKDLPVLGLSAQPCGEIAHGADRGVAGALGEADLAERRVALGDAERQTQVRGHVGASWRSACRPPRASPSPS